MKTEIELLERSLDFIGFIKGDEGEIDDDGLEKEIQQYLDEHEKGSA